MRELWYALALRIVDALLGWTLALPQDLALVIIGTLTAGLLLGVRRLLVDQAALMQVQSDRRRLRELIRQSARGGDREARQRHRRNRSRVICINLRWELPPALLAAIPVALLVTWGSARLEHLPLNDGDVVQIELRMPASAAGQLAHIVPHPEFQAVDGWVRGLEPTPDRHPSWAMAIWNLRMKGPQKTQLTFRVDSRTVEHPLEIGTHRYSPLERHHAQIGTTVVHLPTYNPFGIPWPTALFGLRPWVMGWLCVLIPLYFLGRNASPILWSRSRASRLRTSSPGTGAYTPEGEASSSAESAASPNPRSQVPHH